MNLEFPLEAIKNIDDRRIKDGVRESEGKGKRERERDSIRESRRVRMVAWPLSNCSASWATLSPRRLRDVYS